MSGAGEKWLCVALTTVERVAYGETLTFCAAGGSIGLANAAGHGILDGAPSRLQNKEMMERE
jgi:hypothetical protein